MSHICEIVSGNYKIVITRSELSDGNNYYLTAMNYSDQWKYWFWNESFKQIEEIHSLVDARRAARNAISSFYREQITSNNNIYI
jgi:hypothetical protein